MMLQETARVIPRAMLRMMPPRILSMVNPIRSQVVVYKKVEISASTELNIMSINDAQQKKRNELRNRGALTLSVGIVRFSLK